MPWTASRPGPSIERVDVSAASARSTSAARGVLDDHDVLRPCRRRRARRPACPTGSPVAAQDLGVGGRGGRLPRTARRTSGPNAGSLAGRRSRSWRRRRSEAAVASRAVFRLCLRRRRGAGRAVRHRREPRSGCPGSRRIPRWRPGCWSSSSAPRLRRRAPSAARGEGAGGRGMLRARRVPAAGAALGRGRGRCDAQEPTPRCSSTPGPLCTEAAIANTSANRRRDSARDVEPTRAVADARSGRVARRGSSSAARTALAGGALRASSSISGTCVRAVSRAAASAARRASTPGVACEAGPGLVGGRARGRARPRRARRRARRRGARRADRVRRGVVVVVHGLTELDAPKGSPGSRADRRARRGRGRCENAPCRAGCPARRRSRRSPCRRGRAARPRRGTRASAGRARRRRRGGRRSPPRPGARARCSGAVSGNVFGRNGRRTRRRASSSAALVATRYAQVENFGAAVERTDLAGDREKRFLGRVERIVGIAENPPAHAVHERGVAAQELVECAAIAVRRRVAPAPRRDRRRAPTTIHSCRSIQAIPMTRGPVCTPITGPITPTVTSASGTVGASIVRNSSTSGAFACSTLISSTLPAGT